MTEAGHTRRIVTLAMGVAVMMIAQQLAGKAVRDAFFLSHFASATLPTFMMAASLLSIASVFATGALYRRVAPARVLPTAFLVSGIWFCLEWAASPYYPRLAAASVFIHTSSFGAIVVSGFWSVMNEALDPSTAKRNIGRIAGGATFGGVLGGLTAWQGAQYASVESMVLVLGVINLACGLGISFIAPSTSDKGTVDQETAEESGSRTSPVAIFEETPYLQHLAVLVAMSALAAAIIDYVLKARAAVAFAESEALVVFFAQFYLAVGVGTFLFQFVASRALLFVGLSRAVASMPLVSIGLSAGASILGGLPSVAFLRGSVSVVESSLYRSGYEILFTPLPPEKKRPTKTLIDVGGDKLGAAVGSGLSLAVVDAFPIQANTFLLVVAAGCSGVALFMSRLLHRGYVSALEDSLRTGTIDLDEAAASEPVTATVIAVTAAQLSEPAPDQPRRLPQVRGARPGFEAAPVFDGRLHPGDCDELLAAVAALRSHEPARIRSVIRFFRPLPPELIGFALPSLANPALEVEVGRALQHCGPAALGVLGEVLMSARAPLELRHRIPRLLADWPSLRSLDALERGLEVEALSLRFEVARSLQRLNRRTGQVPSEDLLVEAIERCARDTLWVPNGSQQLLAFSHLLLSTRLASEPLRLALEAVAEGDTARRGTGIEYIENVVPRPLKTTLMPIAGQPATAKAALHPEAAAPPTYPARMELADLVDRLRSTKLKQD